MHGCVVGSAVLTLLFLLTCQQTIVRAIVQLHAQLSSTASLHRTQIVPTRHKTARPAVPAASKVPPLIWLSRTKSTCIVMLPPPTTGCSYADVIKSCEEQRGAYAWTCSRIQVQLKVCASYNRQVENLESEVQRLESEVQRLRALLGSS